MRGSPRQVQTWARKLYGNYDFPSASLDSFSGIINSCEIKAYRSDQVILQEKAVGDEMYILLEGTVSVYKQDLNGKDKHLVDMNEITVFGHMSLADRSPRSATCKATGDVTLACISTNTYNNLITSPTLGTAFRRLMLATLTRQLQMGTSKLAEMLSPPKKTVKRAASKPDKIESLEMLGEYDDITQEDILDLAGVTMGWKLTTKGIDDVQLVVTEDDLRRGFKPER